MAHWRLCCTAASDQEPTLWSALRQKLSVEECPDLGVAPCKGGAFQWVQIPSGNRSNRKQSEQSWR
jgi:hypothetical protein